MSLFGTRRRNTRRSRQRPGVTGRAAGVREGRVAGTRARGPAPEPRLARQLAVVPLVLAVLAAIWVAPHATAWAQARLREAPFLVTQVSVQGLERVTPETVREMLAPAEGLPLVDVDTAALEASLAAHPWVARATAVRWPPDTLRVHVEERTPLAVTPAGEGARPHVVDATGTAFAPAAEDDLARLVAVSLASPPLVGEPDARLLEALELAARFRERGLEVPRRVTLGLPERDASAELRLRGFAPAIFIERDAAEAQLDRLATLLAAHVEPAARARVIDLRFEGRAVLW